MKNDTGLLNGTADVRIIRWRGGQHPSYEGITHQMSHEGLRPYAWKQGPNVRHAVRSHGYGKVMYCVDGALEMIFPDLNQRVVLKPGDRLDLPRGTRYAMIVGPRGAHCVEGELSTRLS